jgi:hypothetical protein
MPDGKSKQTAADRPLPAASNLQLFVFPLLGPEPQNQ